MEGLGNEVMSKIRLAIKNKLADLGAHVDDELPDYIMVMVANKKPKAQMIDDLRVFLGNKTVAFSNWLHDALEKMTLVAAESGTGRVMAEEAEEVLTLKDEPELDDPLSRELQDADALQQSNKAVSVAVRQQEQQQQKPVPLVTVEPMIVSNKAGVAHKAETNNKAETKKTDNISEHKDKPESPTSAQKRHPPTCQVRAVVKKCTTLEPEDDDEDDDSTFGSVASIVKVTERRPSIHPNLQPNSRLLLKAVEEANKSVQMKTAAAHKKLVFVGPCKQPKFDSSRTESEANAKIMLETSDDKESQEEQMIVGSRSQGGVIPFPDRAPQYTPTSTALLSRLTKDSAQDQDAYMGYEGNIIADKDDSDQGTRKRKMDNANDEFIPKKRSNGSSEPHFVVTLNGVDPDQFLTGKTKKTRRSVVSDLEDEDLEDGESRRTMDDELDLELASADEKFLAELEEDIEPMLEGEEDEMEEELADEAEEGVKIRCKYWPACKNGTECPFHHPNIPCIKFPQCKYGTKCLYIHPNCKYDTSCTRLDCPYTHSSKRSPMVMPPPPPPPMYPTAPSKVFCKFFPKCFNPTCPFYHPSKICRFGIACQSSHCPFVHPSYPSRQNLKWVSSHLLSQHTDLGKLTESETSSQK